MPSRWSHGMVSGMSLSLSGEIDGLRGGASSHAVDEDGSHVVALRHGRSWVVGFRLVMDDGRLSVSEMLVRHTGSGGVTAEAIRRLPTGALLTKARGVVSKRLAVPSERVGRIEFVDLTASQLAAFFVDGRGGLRRSDEDYARLAQEYVRRVQAGRSPAKTLHEDFGHGSPGVWANRIADARKRRLLTKARPGESSGRLTAKAERILGF